MHFIPRCLSAKQQVLSEKKINSVLGAINLLIAQGESGSTNLLVAIYLYQVLQSCVWHSGCQIQFITLSFQRFFPVILNFLCNLLITFMCVCGGNGGGGHLHRKALSLHFFLFAWRLLVVLPSPQHSALQWWQSSSLCIDDHTAMLASVPPFDVKALCVWGPSNI